jgi:hypothetical protein
LSEELLEEDEPDDLLTDPLLRPDEELPMLLLEPDVVDL